MPAPIRSLAAVALVALAACGDAVPPGATVERGNAPALDAARIETAADGTCYGNAVTPAVVQTLTAQELESPELRDAEGRVIQPATYRSAIRQEILRERQEVRFATVCPPAYTESFVASLQRALQARGFYVGPVTGSLDQATSRAVQDYQREAGPDSGLLSLESARRLGLVALSAEQIEALSQ